MKRIFFLLVLLTASAPLFAGPFAPIYFPHLAVGGGFQSIINMSNPLADEARVVTVKFFQDNGAPWNVTTNLGDGTEFSVYLPMRGTATLTLSSAVYAIQSGWAVATSDGPSVVAATYAFSPVSAKESVAGVLPATADVLSVLPVTASQPEAVNTGLAIANPNGVNVQINIRLFAEDGALVDIRTLTLPAMGRFVGYINNPLLFPSATNIKGYAQLDSTQPVTCMALRTDLDRFSSLPAVHDVLPWRNAHTRFVSSFTGSDATGDGSLAKPYKTIQKGVSKADPGWTVYLLPGIYSTASGEGFPIPLANCVCIRGAGTDLVYIMGSGPVPGTSLQAAAFGVFRGMLSCATVINPVGAGIYAAESITLVRVRIMFCNGAGLYLAGGNGLFTENQFLQNRIGVFVSVMAQPDLGGGIGYCSGGNVLAGNTQCDLYSESMDLPPIRFNSWDNAVPTAGTVCTGGVDITVNPVPYLVRY